MFSAQEKQTLQNNHWVYVLMPLTLMTSSIYQDSQDVWLYSDTYTLESVTKYNTFITVVQEIHKIWEWVSHKGMLINSSKQA